MLLASVLFAMPGSPLNVLAAPSFVPALFLSNTSGVAGSPLSL